MIKLESFTWNLTVNYWSDFEDWSLTINIEIKMLRTTRFTAWERFDYSIQTELSDAISILKMGLSMKNAFCSLNFSNIGLESVNRIGWSLFWFYLSWILSAKGSKMSQNVIGRDCTISDSIESILLLASSAIPFTHHSLKLFRNRKRLI